MALAQKTLYMAANTGYVVDLGRVFSAVEITATQVCAVKVSATALDTPGTTQIPAADGVTTDFCRLAQNVKESFGFEFPKGGNAELGDAIRYIAVRNEGAAGLLVIKAH